MANEAWFRQEYNESIAILERASRLDPANAGLLLDIGRAYGMRYDCAAAEKYFERAAKVAAQKTEVLAVAGLQCRGFGRYEMAKHYFERAMAEPNSLARYPRETGRTLRALSLYERGQGADRPGAENGCPVRPGPARASPAEPGRWPD